MIFLKNLETNTTNFEAEIGLESSLDLKRGEVCLAGRRCVYYYVDGFLDKPTLERIFAASPTTPEKKTDPHESPLVFAREFLRFADCEMTSDSQKAIAKLLSGYTVLFFDDSACALIAEVRKVPQRSIQEPDKGKTLRGAHEGYCENIITNLALLRRRIQTPKFHADRVTLGKDTATRVAVCYVEEKADMRFVKAVKKKLQSLDLSAVCLGEETVTEALFYHKGISLLNPLPRARFTERPDTCAAVLLEGKVVLLCDTSPSAIILPMSVFDFFEECGDYYFPPFTASYLRIVRFLVFLASVFLIPLWLLAVNTGILLPDGFSFLLIESDYAVPVFLQLLIIEIAIDGLKLASLNTPDPLSNSLSVVGGLLLGDFAVQSGWFVPQTILYSALAALTTFVPNNYELGYSFKFARILLILCVQLFAVWGFISASVFLFLVLLCTKSEFGKSYLYPFVPFSLRGIIKIFVRTLHGRETKKL